MKTTNTSYRAITFIQNLFVYLILAAFAYLMLFPFLFMFSTSLKYQQDTFRYPPRLLPMKQRLVNVESIEEPVPLYYVDYQGDEREFALVETNIRIGTFVDPMHPTVFHDRLMEEVNPTGGTENPATTTWDGEEAELYDVVLDGETIPMVLLSQTAVGRFVNPEDPNESVLQNVRTSTPVEDPTVRSQNYQEVTELQGLDRSLTNTALVTILVVSGQLITSVVGGYALARLRFPGRDQLFVIYLGTIMIPFVVLITPLYQLMVIIGWVDKLASLVFPWIFTAYGTFLMRQFFITIPKEIEEAALIDGASRFEILWRIFLPASVPALATLATFTFLYAWNSFFWPLVIINTGNRLNHVLTLSLSQLRGRASDNANLVMAGAAIAILPPMIVYILAQRFFVESATSSGVKG
ncbi:MAG: carbohydrate ABC transporter permease [Anaerolineales bacterium]|nr:carbohydrate ABC transporter permease [Anaerolineales bacterium]